jgi:hypothetical protein
MQVNDGEDTLVLVRTISRGIGVTTEQFSEEARCFIDAFRAQFPASFRGLNHGSIILLKYSASSQIKLGLPRRESVIQEIHSSPT